MWEDAFMRTTLELPDELLKRAKIAAVERGVTLRELIGSALARELQADPPPAPRRKRVQLPIFPSVAPGTLRLTNADLAEAEAEEDARRHGLSR
jgi:hypothetical protein